MTLSYTPSDVFPRADRLPYGRDFDTHLPTGRFSNGRIPVDFLASRLGIPLVPSYLENAGTIEAMIHGVNYASAGARIIFATGSDLGLSISDHKRNMAAALACLTENIQAVNETLEVS